ncbi:hypothetical protein FHY25_003841 [Xanthomonas arboricola]|uniref:hypothetical protein n=1 Tax=Xanthomonas campestris TaxID=339 RepID=UPI0023E9AC75|nr:hypothetical protein [Xanthomonas campestris]
MDRKPLVPTGRARPSEIKARSPPNPEVLDGLLRCFDESYMVAYGAARWRQGTSTFVK